MTEQYEIGMKTFFRGNKITITSEPYELYGALWQNGINETGKTFTVKTPEQRAIDTKTTQAEREEQQAGLKRLKELQKQG